MDVLAGGDRRERHFAVQGVGRRDRDDLDLRIDQIAPVAVAPEAEPLRRPRRRFRVVVGDARNGPQPHREDAGNGPVSEGVRLAHMGPVPMLPTRGAGSMRGIIGGSPWSYAFAGRTRISSRSILGALRRGPQSFAAWRGRMRRCLRNGRIEMDRTLP